MSLDARVSWVDGADELSLTRQCELAEVPRATVYRRLTAKVPAETCAEDLLLCKLIDEQYTPAGRSTAAGAWWCSCVQRATWSTASACSG